MNPEVVKKPGKTTSRKIVLISLITFILLMLAITAQITYTILKYNNIYNGVFIEDINAGKEPKDELVKLLKNKYEGGIKGINLSIPEKGIMQEIKFENIDLKYGVDDAINKAFAIGRTGNIFERLRDIYNTGKNGVRVDIPLSYNKDKIQKVVDELYSRIFVSVKEADLLIQEDKVIIRSGHHGESFDKNEVISQIEKAIRIYNGKPIEITIIDTQPGKISVDDIYNKVSKEPEDALVKVTSNNVAITPHVNGRTIDKSALVRVASELENSENSQKELPVVFIKPKVLTSDIYAKLFKDTLYTMTTKFSTSTTNDANRGVNIRLAVSKINGKILAPGQGFSFNEVVGPRTRDAGYKTAHVYSGGKVIDDIGGGICQVSTTLYNAVLYSNLEVLSRTNHMFTVGYVPYGRDAAVSYGSVDFKFKNSTKWPIKINGNVTKDNHIVFSITGTSENPGVTVQIESQTIKTIDYKTQYIDDPSLGQGKTVIVQSGMKGYIIDTYKIIKKYGKVISKTKLHRSTYNALSRIEKRNVSKQPNQPTPLPVSAPTPTPTPQKVTGVDDSSNPPVKPLGEGVEPLSTQ